MSGLSKLITVKTRSQGRVPDITTIPLSKATRDRLRTAGRKGETYDALLLRLLAVYENRTVTFEEV
jgi:hypothetical protein